MMKKIMKKGAAVALSAAMMFTFVPVLGMDGNEAHAAGGSSFSNAKTIALDGSDVDNDVYRTDKYWKFKTSGRDSYYVIEAANGRSDSAYMYLYNSQKTSLDDTSIWRYSTSQITEKLDRNSTHYIKVSPSSNSEASGIVTVWVKELVDNAGENYTTAKVITGSANGAIEVYGDSDWFKFTAPQAGKYRIKVSNKSSDNSLGWDVYNKNVTNILDESTWLNETEYYELNLSKGSVIYVRMGYSNQRALKYKLSISRIIPKPAQPVITKAKAGKKKITLQWRPAGKATGYQVCYKKANSGKWNTRTVAGIRLTIKKLKRKAVYKVKVRSVRTEGNSKTYSKWSTTKTLKVK